MDIDEVRAKINGATADECYCNAGPTPHVVSSPFGFEQVARVHWWTTPNGAPEILRLERVDAWTCATCGVPLAPGAPGEWIHVATGSPNHAPVPRPRAAP